MVRVSYRNFNILFTTIIKKGINPKYLYVCGWEDVLENEMLSTEF